MPPEIHLAFRFHGNFYHSYRGDTPDEFGFGKDIRIIRHLIRTLDDLNQRGIPVCGTWDFENYFSLETIMPAHCPDIIADLQRRVRAGQDDVELMSYNNGLINAHTPREFEAAIRRAVTNPAGSGLRDLFGSNFRGLVRPQEMMYTPIHLQLYQDCGIHAISLYYSALPFNAFSNFVPPLSLVERYNPLTLTYPGIAETMTLLPCYNIGDLVDHLTLRRWVKQMRRAQLELENPPDLLLLIDMDADDEFWVGFNIPFLGKYISTTRGLRGLVEDVAGLDYVRFTTPDRYLVDHPPVGSLSIGQDTADGSFDGLASWAEKWSNQRLWTGLERARILDMQSRHLAGASLPEEIERLLNESFEARLKALSTTHFGMAAPVMNRAREAAARGLVQQAVETAAAAFVAVAEPTSPGSFSLINYPRIESAACPANRSRGLIRIRLQPHVPAAVVVKNAAGQSIPAAMLARETHRELLFVAAFNPAERKDYRIEANSSGGVAPSSPVIVSPSGIQNEYLKIDLSPEGQVHRLQGEEDHHKSECFLLSGVTYGKRKLRVASWKICESLSLGVVGLVRMAGHLDLPGGYRVYYERELMLAAGLPYLYLNLRVTYPSTPHKGFNAARAQRLQQSWDPRWREVRPCEIHPGLAGSASSPLRVWKHNYCGHVSTFSLDYGRFSHNNTLDSANNQITHAWVAVSDGQRGLLIAQNADTLANLAFCPVRTHRQGQTMRVNLNPFGSYWGRQYRYGIADTNLGNLLATRFSASDHINSYAPSFNGRVQEFSLMIAPYSGDCPPEGLQQDAEAFSYPYLLLDDDVFIAQPAHRTWDGSGLGEVPPDQVQDVS